MLRDDGLILPDFLIVGAMRSGTDTLRNTLMLHPDIFMPGPPEIQFFNRPERWRAGGRWYARHFEQCSGEKVIGEKSASYSYRPALVPSVPERIHQLLPHAKLVWSLRNPLSRAYSHYWNARVIGKENLDFEQALETRVRPDWRAYKDRSVYINQIREFARWFPMEQMYFLVFEEMCTAPGPVVRPLVSFLGLDPLALPEPAGRAKGKRSGAPRSQWLAARLPFLDKRTSRKTYSKLLRANRKRRYPPMKPETRARLQEFFAPFNEQLAAEVRLDLSSWQAG